MERETNRVVEIIKDQWSRVWAMWEELIRTIPADEWTKGNCGYLVPVRHVIHTLDCAYVFTRNKLLEQYDPSEWYGVKIEENPFEIPSEILWSKEKALEKLAETRKILEDRLATLDDQSLLQLENTHPWTGQTRMEKILYVLRHTQHHLGAVEIEMGRRGIRAFTWEKEKAKEQGIEPWW